MRLLRADNFPRGRVVTIDLATKTLATKSFHTIENKFGLLLLILSFI
jgi:hypothetical protein